MIIKPLKRLLLLSFILLITGNCGDRSRGRCRGPCPSIFTCKINGEAWGESWKFNEVDITASYAPDHRAVPYLGPGYLDISGIGDDWGIVWLVMRGGASCPRSYELKDLKDTLAYAGCYLSEPNSLGYYRYTNIVDGNINLSHIQADNYDFIGSRLGRAKGTFWVTLTNEVGDTVRITDGVFDTELPN